MSLFKEKDDFITQAFINQFDSDSETSSHEPTGDEELIAVSNENHSNSVDIIQEDPTEKPELPSDKESDSLETPKSKTTPKFRKTQKRKKKSPNNNVPQSPVIECVILSSGSEDDTSNKRYLRSDKNKNNNSTLQSNAPEFIQISSDDDDQCEVVEQQSLASNVSSTIDSTSSFDLDDLEFNLKLNLAGTYKKFSTTYKTKLRDCLKEFIEELKSKGKDLVVMFKNEEVTLDQSPYSLKLRPASMLTAIEVNSVKTFTPNPNEITIKLQDGNRKHTKEFRIIKDEPMAKLRQKYAQEFKLNPAKIKFLFDGDLVGDDSTPEELEIEDDCVVDVMVS